MKPSLGGQIFETLLALLVTFVIAAVVFGLGALLTLL